MNGHSENGSNLTNGSATNGEITNGEKKQIRVYIDGCFDLFHFGHANAIRQAKKLGDVLVLGIHNDEQITTKKRPPVFKEEERYRLVKGLKWADEVVVDTPYNPTIQLLDDLNCDFCAHGDDLVISKDGTDTYGAVRSAGRLKLFKRTTGVSTTDIIQRVLHLISEEGKKERENGVLCREEAFISTTRIAQFLDGFLSSPKRGQKIVYVTGSWDLFHAAHMDFLEAAKKEGDFLIVGVYSDSIVHRKKGGIFPVLNLNERALGILSCKCVNEVITNAPYKITAKFVKEKRIDVVCHGWTEISHPDLDLDPFEEVREMGKLKMIDTGNKLTSEKILQRIVDRKDEYQELITQKLARDQAAETNGGPPKSD